MTIAPRELGVAAADRRLLRVFYDQLYLPEFPDPDERESLDNIERYLERKAAGWYGPNNYHVRLVLEGDRPVAGVISDYLAGPNSGVIEFLVVSPACRGRGVGTALIASTEDALAADAAAAGCSALDVIVAEMNDPFRRPAGDDALDPFLRLLIWGGWGYERLDVPYVQPALSPAQRPVASMLLAMKRRGDGPTPTPGLPSARVKHILHEYLRWAMRIDVPECSPEYRAMVRHLETIDVVGAVPLDRYVGHDPHRPLAVREVLGGDDPDLEAVIALYERSFGGTVTAVDAAAFRTAFHASDDARRHVWAVRACPGDRVAGMTSFFTLRGAGFGGYLVLEPPLRGTGRLPLLVARIEEQMIRDRRGARGWYVECDDGVVGAFRRAGFHELAVAYRQPAIRPGQEAPALRLLYKEFGRRYTPPALPPTAFLDDMRRVYRVVYRLERPEDDDLYRDLERQVGRIAGEVVPVR